MSLQRKCLTASAVAHGLLVLLIFVGSAFIPQKPKIEGPEFEIVNIPDVLVEEPNVISGNPNAGRPAETPPPPIQPLPVQPQPVAPPVKPVEPPKEAPKQQPVEKITPANPEPNPFDLTKAKQVKTPVKPDKPESSFDLAQARKQKIQTTTSPQAQTTDNRAVDNAKEAARLQQVLDGARKTLQGTGSRVGISASDIIGPGGAAQMSYDLAVAKFYEAEFKRRSSSLSTRGNEPPVEAEVTVRRDGTVVGDRVVKKSGRAQFDRTVQDVLNTVKKNKVIPFPADFKSETRTIRINFNLDDL